MPDTETPAAQLRTAAKWMRKRAEAATPGPWRPVSALYQDDAFSAVLDDRGDVDDPRTWLVGSGLGAVNPAGTVDHIASWHPLVALAVADWLEVEAAAADLVANDPVTAKAVGLPDKRALAVARAYLGETDAT